MPVYIDTRGNSVLSVAICDRCNRKFPYTELMPDPNFPGMRVCKDDLDQFDPWRLPARQTENIALRFPRPDQQLSGISNSTDGLISTEGGPNGSPNGGNAPFSNTQYDNLFIDGTPYGVAAAPGDVSLFGTGPNNQTQNIFPTITLIAPANGPQAGGTVVTITGTNFTNVSSVRFAGLDGTALTIVDAQHLLVTSPAYPTTGSVDVTVISPEGTAVWHGAFTYN